MAANESDFLERVGELQRQLHASERKRLELEKNLLVCSKADQWKLRHAQLKSYLKEVRERERKAQLRNQQLLKDFGSIEAQISALTTSLDTWKQMKMEYEKQMEILLPVWREKLKTQGREKEEILEQKRNSSGQTSTTVSKNLSVGLYHTATHFMGQQTSETTDRTCSSPQQNHYQPMESFLSPQPNRQVAPVTAKQSNSVMDNLKLLTSSTGRQDFQTVSDIIDGKTGLPGSEVMPLIPIISSKPARCNNEGTEINKNIIGKGSVGSSELALSVAQLEPIKKEMKEGTVQNDVKNHLTVEDKIPNNPAACVQTPEQFQRLSMDPVQLAGSSDMTLKGNSIFQLSNTFFDSTLTQDLNKDATKAQRPSQDVQRLADEVYNSESDISSSGSSEELQLKEYLDDTYNFIQSPKTAVSDDLEKTNEAPFTKDESTSVSIKQHSVPSLTQPSVSDCGSSANADLHGELCGSAAQSLNDEGCLLFEGFCHLLQSIEDAVGGTKTTYSELYQTTAISSEKLKEITRICNRKGSLNKESLEACGAVVLHHFKTLLRSTSNPCLFSDEILKKDWETLNEVNESLSNLPGDSATLWKHWYSHVLSLLEHQALSTDEIAEIFGPLFVAEDSNSKKAIALLKKILSKAIETQSIQSDDSSCSLSSILNNSAEINATNPVPWLFQDKTKQQETRAYKLLKQSAMQQNRKDDSDLHSPDKKNLKYTKKMKNDNDGDNCETDSSEESSHLKCRNKHEGINPAKSKAFWGESDDSATDIEAILHPKTSEVQNDEDDFDDFFS
ncbi:centrosomal protein kizuna isoform X2 [Hypanus sabinus]|uniref:centrosomal protein kizuna isoform X2 n=1 Tax=Hypanus sabinus TaxID=79690 RepID=UPI0028C3CF67|nr:centrosomal protein kizuna isoform X2 [Hypanus sabinus]